MSVSWPDAIASLAPQILQLPKETPTVSFGGDDEQSIADLQAGAEKLSDGVEKKLLVLVELDRMAVLGRFGKERRPNVLASRRAPSVEN